jgi:hypothetical protein
MGLFELLKLPPLENNSSTNDTTFLKFISGKNSEGEKAKQLRENIETFEMDKYYKFFLIKTNG